MKRAFAVAAGTLAATAGVLAYQPGSLATTTSPSLPATATSTDATSSDTTTPTTTTPTTTTPTTTTPTTTTPASAAATTGGTFLGAASQTRWGPVQVQITVADGQVTDVTTVSYPNSDHHSSQLSSYAIPTLQQEAVAAQSADIASVSGASYTSAAFAESLQSALQQAGL